MPNRWSVAFHDLFAGEFDQLEDAVQDELLAQPCCWSSSAQGLVALRWIRYKAAGTRT